MWWGGKSATVGGTPSKKRGAETWGRALIVTAVVKVPLYGLQAVGFHEDSRKGQQKQLILIT